MQRWQYRWYKFWWDGKNYVTTTPDGGTLTGQGVWDFINAFGQDGWELVNVVGEVTSEISNYPGNMGDIDGDTPVADVHTTSWMLWFKRPLQPA